jgi:hypothetical protein
VISRWRKAGLCLRQGEGQLDRGADEGVRMTQDAVQGGLGVDGGLVPVPVQAAIFDVEDEVLRPCIC